MDRRLDMKLYDLYQESETIEEFVALGKANTNYSEAFLYVYFLETCSEDKCYE